MSKTLLAGPLPDKGTKHLLIASQELAGLLGARQFLLTKFICQLAE